MNNLQPLFNPATHYRIEVHGQVEINWLQSFISSAEIALDETRQMVDITVIKVQTDQAGLIGLLRKLHGLGVAIIQLKIISNR